MMLQLIESLSLKQLKGRGFTSRSVPTKLGKHHVLVAEGKGKLPPVVFVHGIGANAVGYTPVLLQALKDFRRVIAIDLLGHGLSDEPASEVTYLTVFAAAAEALCQIITEPHIFVGNSLGGAFSCFMAREHPARVEGLSLWSPGGAPFTPHEVKLVKSRFDMHSRADGIRLLQAVYVNMPLLAHLIAGDISAIYRKKSIQQILASIEANRDDLGDFLPTLNIPVQLVWGKEEKVLPSSGLAYFRSKLPKHAEILEPVGMGHCPQIEHPRDIYRMFRDFAVAKWPGRVAGV